MEADVVSVEGCAETDGMVVLKLETALVLSAAVGADLG